MNWYWHLAIHWLDLFRHFLCYAFAPENWVTNGSEQIIAIVVGFIISALLWPKLRHAIEAWAHKILQHHHNTVVQPAMDAHHEALKAHVVDELQKVHDHLTDVKNTDKLDSDPNKETE